MEERGKRNPEGGEGIKYYLQKTVTIRPGIYRVYFGLAEDKFQKDVTINVREGSENVIEYVPIYRYDRVLGPTFYEGLKNYDIFVNGEMIDGNK